jgi:hypothetical protein
MSKDFLLMASIYGSVPRLFFVDIELIFEFDLRKGNPAPCRPVVPFTLNDIKKDIFVVHLNMFFDDLGYGLKKFFFHFITPPRKHQYLGKDEIGASALVDGTVRCGCCVNGNMAVGWIDLQGFTIASLTFFAMCSSFSLSISSEMCIFKNGILDSCNFFWR